MSNIISLFQDTKIVAAPDLAGCVRMSVTNIVAQNMKLVRAVQDLHKRLDALDVIADSICDRRARECLLQLSRLHRETLTGASNELSFELKKLPTLWNKFIQDWELLEKPLASVSL